MERINAIMLRSGKLRSKSVGGKPAARKIAATPYKNNPGDDRHFVSAFKQGFGPAFFFIFSCWRGPQWDLQRRLAIQLPDSKLQL
jgi:hypothetical protein